MSPRNEAATDHNRSRGAGGVWGISGVSTFSEVTPVEPVAKAATPEQQTAKAPDISIR